MIENNRILAIIPARAGSKGLPGKNYKPICGKPLIWWSIEAARRSKYNITIAVSTNCSMIKKIVKSFNKKNKKNTVYTIIRPDDLCGDKSTTESAMQHSVNYLKLNNNLSFEQILLLQPTSPLRKKDIIDNAIDIKHHLNKRSLLTVSEHSPFFFNIKTDNNTKLLFDPKNRKIRQDLNKTDMLYHDDGCLYLTDIDVLMNDNCRLDNDPFLLVNEPCSSLQIDSEFDFLIISKIMKKVRRSGMYI